ncbi:MAG: methyltransferase domain-containing protein [Acidimicrobiia bacterium]
MTWFDWKGRLGPLRLRLTDAVFKPSTVSGLIAQTMEVNEGDTVIDVGCGCGVLSIIAAKLGAGHVHAVDMSPDVVKVGTANAEEHGVADRITFYRGDLFEPLPEGIKADLIIGDVSGIPDELAAESGWFPTGKGGGPTGAELPMRMLREARRWLKDNGRLLLPTGSLQNQEAILEAARTLYGSVQERVSRAIPLPGNLMAGRALPSLVREGIVELKERGSRYLWKAQVWELSST